MTAHPVTVIGPKDELPQGRDVIVVNTTSRSTDFCKVLSPFILGPVRLWGQFYTRTVENGWQYTKVYARHWDADRQQPRPEWLAWAKAGWLNPRAKRYPMGKGVKPICSWWAGQRMYYLEARRCIFLPLYRACAELAPAFQELLNRRLAGRRIVLWDFDGYDHRRLGMTYNDVLNDETRTMGHAFILAMMLEGLL